MLTLNRNEATPMSSDHGNQHTTEYLHTEVAKSLGISVDELTTWMINDIERVTEGGKDVGHMVVFRESTPDEVLDKVQHKQSRFTAMTGVIKAEQA
ncbi:hypothetical protein IW875_14900 [Pseudomonas sp. LY10J]|nr:hypothetical protein [Pseudomonas sp. LY10J]